MGKGAVPARALIGCVALLLAASGLACSGTSHSTPDGSGAPRLGVVASVFPLAELARRVGLDRVQVTDLSASAPDPSAVIGGVAVDRAGVILLVGRGFQPDLERATNGRPHVVQLAPTDDDRDLRAWLDPVAMQQLGLRVADGLSRADPAGRSAYQAAAKVYNAQLGALDIDYRASLADCARRDLVTADGAFRRLAGRYGLVGHTVGDADIGQLLAAQRVTTIFTEPLAPPAPALALARQFHVKTQMLETLEQRTPAEANRAATYVSLMTDNLAKLRAAQGCTGSNAT